MDKNKELIERYIYQVSTYLPYNQKEDIKNELRSIIEDMLEERCKDVLPSDKDIRVVLAELGTPDEVGAQYGLGKQKSLISGIYLIKYKLFLKILLVAVAIGLLISAVLNIILNGNNFTSEIYNLILGLISLGLSLVGATTIAFALLEKNSINIEEFKIDNLPPVPKKEEKISIIESVISIVFNVLFVVILIAAPNLIEFNVAFESTSVSVFNIEYIRSIWGIILLVGVAGVLDDIIKIIDVRYTKRVMITNIITNSISIITFFLMFNGNKILTPEFLDFANKTDATAAYINFFPLICAIFFTIDIITTVYRTIKAEKNNI